MNDCKKNKGNKCKYDMMDIDTCISHEICIETTFDQNIFGKMPNNTDYVCAEAAAWKNCTKLDQEVHEPLNSISTPHILLVVLGVTLIITMVLVTYYRYHKKKKSHDEDVPITPREGLYTEIDF